jgi:hypothetical protein
MPGMTTILQAAIGLIFVFLLFSLLVSAINEAVFGHLTKLRSRVLEDSLHAILSNKAKGFSLWAVSKRWLGSLVDFVRGLPAMMKAKDPAANKPGKPSQIQGAFSDQLMDHPLVRGLRIGRRRCPSYLPAEIFADAVVGILAKTTGNASPGPGAGDKSDFTDVTLSLSGLDDAHAKEVLRSVLAGTKDLGEARARLETWFDNAMERVSGAYKRYTQFWLYLWTAAIVIWLNIDTLEITRRLVADAQFRGALAMGAANFMAQANASNATVTATSPRVNQGDTDIGTHPAKDKPAGGTPSVTQLLEDIGKLNLPLGWGACTNSAQKSWIGGVITRLPRLQLGTEMQTNSTATTFLSGAIAAAAPCPATPQAWRLKMLGLLISIAAISQGAPFWFDLLNRVTNLRASGRPPEPRKGDAGA